MSSEIETPIGLALSCRGVSTSLDTNGYGGKMAFWTYILSCADGKYYSGHTDDLEKGIGQHQSGAIEGFTLSRLPVRLMWSQDFLTRYEALDAELKIKGWSQAKKAALIRGDWDAVGFYARPPKERNFLSVRVSASPDTNGR